MNKLIFSAAVFSFSFSPFFAMSASAEDFCGQIESVYFKDFNGKISAYLDLSDIKDQNSHEILSYSKLTITDPQVVFKVARVISKTSIQDSAQLEKDLRDSKFEWDSTVNDEEHPNPMVEDFVACLSASLDLIKKDRIVSEVIQINDIREDGYSILDLVD